jgi:long-chain acyl-CoA synthetase
MKCAVYKKLVASKFKKLGGGRIRAIVVGGAPLNRQIAKIVYVLGFNIIEGYGLTETAPVVSSNTVEDNILGTVGRPFDSIEVKIGENDEILVRGPNVMKGYYHKPEETAKVLDPDGWLHTGDQGKFDEHGHLVITGRIKELIVTSGGKKIPPAPIEARITFSPFIEQAVVWGENKQYLVALVIPSREAIEKHAKAQALRRAT